MRAPTRLAAPVLGLVLTLCLVGGCSSGIEDVPLPGTGVSGETITVRADFAEALNLTRGATVRVNGVESGKVQGISVEDFHAEVEMLVRSDAELREGASARLRYTTPLGELFVDVTNPRQGEQLADGAELGLSDTSTAPTVEDTLAQASLLINGGGLEQLQTITEELNTAIGGREGTVRRLLERTETFLREANASTGDIDRVLRSLASVSKTLNARERIIDRAVREITPAARVLRENTPGFTELLAEIERFSGAANATVRATRRQLLQIIDQAEPVLAEFARNQAVYPGSLRSLVTAGDVLDEAVPGDYVALRLATHLDNLQIGPLQDLFEMLDIPLVDDLPILGDLTRPDGRSGPGRGGAGRGGRNGGGPQELLDDLAGSLGLSGLLGGAR